jgi:peptidoglycan/LPS O-acetylase OafA/YrhL
VVQWRGYRDTARGAITAVMQPDKVQYLEGLRGIAAIQVVLLHFVTGFMPGTAQHAWPPLRVLFDGHTAVYVFFLISGAVLTPSFARRGPFVGKLAKRVVRLELPVAAAAVIATALIAAFPDAHRQAAAIPGSAWLAMDSSGEPTIAHLAREIGLDSLLLGYREATLFAPLAQHLPPMEQSLDAPFWSLHLELYGSLLVLCLVSLRNASVWLHRIAIAAAALLFGTHPMFLFVIGDLSSGFLRSAQASVAGALLLVLGFALCASKDWAPVEWLRVWLSSPGFAAAPNLFQFQSQLGAVALYFGVLFCRAAWPLLEGSAGRRLGRLSFSIYLLHFPIMFTLVCVAFTIVPSPAAAFVLFMVFTFLAAAAFEYLVADEHTFEFASSGISRTRDANRAALLGIGRTARVDRDDPPDRPRLLHSPGQHGRFAGRRRMRRWNTAGGKSTAMNQAAPCGLQPHRTGAAAECDGAAIACRRKPMGPSSLLAAQPVHQRVGRLGVHDERLPRHRLREARAGECGQFPAPGGFVGRSFAAVWTDPPLARQHQGGGELGRLIVGQGAPRGLGIDALRGQVQCDRPARPPGTHQAPRSALGIGRVVHRARRNQSPDDLADRRARLRCLGRDGFPVGVGRAARPSLDPTLEHAPQPGLGRGIAGEVVQRRVVQAFRVGGGAGRSATRCQSRTSMSS